MNKEEAIMRDGQSKKSDAVNISYQIRQEDGSTVIVDKCQSVFGEQRLTDYYHDLCQRQKQDVQKEDDRKIEKNLDK